MKYIKKLLFVLGVAAVICTAGSPFANVQAQSVISEQCEGVTNSTVCTNQNQSSGNLFQSIVDILIFLVGSISVIMVIVAGIMYGISAGDSGTVTRAKNTLTYAIIGVLVAVFAYAIVHFVLDKFAK